MTTPLLLFFLFQNFCFQFFSDICSENISVLWTEVETKADKIKLKSIFCCRRRSPTFSEGFCWMSGGDDFLWGLIIWNSSSNALIRTKIEGSNSRLKFLEPIVSLKRKFTPKSGNGVKLCNYDKISPLEWLRIIDL